MSAAVSQSNRSAWALAWRLMRTHSPLYSASMALWIGFHAWPLTMGLAVRAILNRLELGGDLESMFAALVACELVRLAIMYGASTVWSANWMILSSTLRVNMLAWMLRERGPALRRGTTGDQLSRFRDDSEELLNLVDTWLDLAGTGMFALIGLVVLASIDLGLAAVVVAPLSLIAVSTRIFGDRWKQYARAARQATALVTGFVGEVFSSVAAIKVGAAEPAAIARLRRLGDDRRAASIRGRLSYELINAVNLNAVHLAIAVVMMLGASKLRSGQLTVGDLALFFSYVSSMATFPRFLGHLMYRQRQAAVGADRMLGLLADAPPSVLVRRAPLYLGADETPPCPAGLRRAPEDRLEHLSAVGLTHVFDESGHGVCGVSFDLPAGSFTVVTGAVGSGKTTLLRVLLGLVPDQGGAVRWNGRPILDRAHFLVPPRVAYTAQVPRLFSDSVADNVLLGRGGDLEAAITRAVLEEDLADMARGVDTVIGPRGVRLSGGQVQRVAAARMFAQDPELLVFDDLSSALDVDTEHELWRRLLDGPTAERPTCLVVSHRPFVLRRADQIVVLDDGAVVARGSFSEVRRHLGAGRLSTSGPRQPRARPRPSHPAAALRRDG